MNEILRRKIKEIKNDPYYSDVIDYFENRNSSNNGDADTQQITRKMLLTDPIFASRLIEKDPAEYARIMGE